MMSVIRQSVIQLGRTTNDDQSFFFLLLITTKINFFLQLNEMKACHKQALQQYKWQLLTIFIH